MRVEARFQYAFQAAFLVASASPTAGHFFKMSRQRVNCVNATTLSASVATWKKLRSIPGGSVNNRSHMSRLRLLQPKSVDGGKEINFYNSLREVLISRDFLL